MRLHSHKHLKLINFSFHVRLRWIHNKFTREKNARTKFVSTHQHCNSLLCLWWLFHAISYSYNRGMLSAKKIPVLFRCGYVPNIVHCGWAWIAASRMFLFHRNRVVNLDGWLKRQLHKLRVNALTHHLGSTSLIKCRERTIPIEHVWETVIPHTFSHIHTYTVGWFPFQSRLTLKDSRSHYILFSIWLAVCDQLSVRHPFC